MLLRLNESTHGPWLEQNPPVDAPVRPFALHSIRLPLFLPPPPHSLLTLWSGSAADVGRTAPVFLSPLLPLPDPVALLAHPRASLGLLVGGLRDDALRAHDPYGAEHLPEAFRQAFQSLRERRHEGEAHLLSRSR